jgi:hypothetical protein
MVILMRRDQLHTGRWVVTTSIVDEARVVFIRYPALGDELSFAQMPAAKCRTREFMIS